MNWRKSNAAMSEVYKRSPWLYMIEWRERLDRCLEHLNAAAQDRTNEMDPENARYEARALRSSAEYLIATADRLDANASRREKIAAMRNVAGRTPTEAAAFLAKADELEARGAA